MDQTNYAAWRDETIAKLLKKEHYNLYDLCDVVVILRGEGGCPWDREQDHHSVRKGLIEECYEVVEAIDREDSGLLREELGDVLLQIVFHADMEKDAGRFDIDDVAHDECVKMIHRHPHVFGTVEVENSDEVLRNWEVIKTEEKQRVTLADRLNAIPPMLPALMRAQKVGKKAEVDADASVGELCSGMMALLSTLPQSSSQRQAEILGEVLFKTTSLCRSLGFEAEEVLTQKTNEIIQNIAKQS